MTASDKEHTLWTDHLSNGGGSELLPNREPPQNQLADGLKTTVNDSGQFVTIKLVEIISGVGSKFRNRTQQRGKRQSGGSFA